MTYNLKDLQIHKNGDGSFVAEAVVEHNTPYERETLKLPLIRFGAVEGGKVTIIKSQNLETPGFEVYIGDLVGFAPSIGETGLPYVVTDSIQKMTIEEIEAAMGCKIILMPSERN